MRTKILTAKERHAIEKYLSADGEKPGLIRMLAQRVRQNLMKLHSDLDLIDRFHEAYAKKDGHKKARS